MEDWAQPRLVHMTLCHVWRDIDFLTRCRSSLYCYLQAQELSLKHRISVKLTRQSQALHSVSTEEWVPACESPPGTYEAWGDNALP